MPVPKDSGSNFAQALSRASTGPEIMGSPGEIPDGFPFVAEKTHRVVDSTNLPNKVEGAVEYDYEIHRDVFLIFRPWENCSRCLAMLQQVTLPDDGDHICPHTRAAAHKKIYDKVLDGEFMLVSEREVDMRDGSIVVSTAWASRRPMSKQKLRKQRVQELRAAGEFVEATKLELETKENSEGDTTSPL